MAVDGQQQHHNSIQHTRIPLSTKSDTFQASP